MEYYDRRSEDVIQGHSSYIIENKAGGEVCTFLPVNGEVFGYVRVRDGGQIRIERLGADPKDEFIDGITVVWTAPIPKGDTAIISWYREATVYRNPQQFTNIPPVHAQKNIIFYRIKALATQATLLPVATRAFPIVNGVKGNMGQNSLWYADKPENADTVKKVLEYIGKIESRSE